MSTPPSPAKRVLRPHTPNIQTPVKQSNTPIRTSSVTRTASERRKRASLNSPLASPGVSSTLKQSSSSGTPVQRLQRQTSVSLTPRSSTKKRFQTTTEHVNDIKVIARFRPENEAEKNGESELIAKFLDTENVQLNSESFTFDRVFGPEASQNDIFRYSVSQTVDDLFQGYNGTVLAYGQTGSGKSYTMMGPDIAHDSHKGIIPRITDMIFENLKSQDSKTEYTLSASYLEIYLEQIRDLLLSPNEFVESNLQVHEDSVNGVHVRDLTKVYIGSTADIYRVLEKGTELRATASTGMNLESSRSHAIFQINLTQENPEFGIKRSKLFLVDLAGSEKVSRTGVSSQGLEEAKKINSSLSSLGNVINALTDLKSSHIPYRDSKLTRILQESLGGNSRTSLIINCSPSSQNEAETLSTLRFGARAKKIKNKAHINAEPSQLDLINQIEQLKKINEEQKLYTKSLEYEIELLKADGKKTINESITCETEHSPRIQKVTEITEGDKAAKKGLLDDVQLKSRSNSTVSTGFEEVTDEFVGTQKLQESEKINKELMQDLEEKCLKLVTVQLELENTKEELQRERYITRNSAKLSTQFNEELQDAQKQNEQLRHELTTVRSISETRQERIRTLEAIVKEYGCISPSIDAKQPSSSSSSGNGYLSKWSKSLMAYGSTSKTPNLRSDYTSDLIDNRIYRTGMDIQVDPTDADLSFDGIGSGHELGSGRPQASRSVPDSHMRRMSASSHGSSTGGSRIGLNLNIIKPLRGGNNVISES